MTLLLDDCLYSKVAHFVAVVAGDNAITETAHNKIDNIVLPAFIPANKTDKFVTCGLCNVLRQIMKHSIKLQETAERRNEMELYLGYKQNCLKGCAAISNWTKFCEKDFPLAVGKLIEKVKKENVLKLPEEFIQLEKEFTVPKKTANAKKHHLAGRGYKLSADGTIDINVIKNIIAKIVMNSEVCDTDNSLNIPVTNNYKEIIKRKNQIFWPYLCGFDITIADLLILGFIVELVYTMPCICMVRDFFVSLPNIFRWFSECFSKSSIGNAVSKIWPQRSYESCVNLQSPIFSTNIALEEIQHVTYVKRTFDTKHMHSKITKLLPSILLELSNHNIKPIFDTNYKVNSICWSELPDEVNPVEGELDSSRALRKRQQIENMVSQILPLLNSGDKMVDFCAGGGHLGIVIAYLRPDCYVILLENKEESIDRALCRITKLGLTNISLRLSNLEYLVGKFDVGVALHACGSATDLVLQKCVEWNASFVICPCCYGSAKPSDTLNYPGSKMYQVSGIHESDFVILSHSADQTSSNYESEYSKQGKNCMLYVDYDRILKAEDVGRYETHIYSMIPESCSPKNNIIVGKAKKM